MLFFVLYYIASFLTIWNPLASTVGALVLVVMFVYYTRGNSALALSLILANAIIGSFGYEFAINIGDAKISIRILLFATCILMLMSSKDFWSRLSVSIKNSNAMKLWIAFFALAILAVVRGILRSNPLGFVIGDANNYLYFVALPLIGIYKKELQALGVSLFSSAWYALVSLSALSVYVFSHNFGVFNSWLYTWIRDARIGEVTRVSLDSQFHRVFFQAHS
ncbi:hypothetical protein IT409_03030, partial [Candidatus Falkowbacteria bacterium]|nr:hypothetical protein [Candidatus Falkowbacteria bacterium]